MRQYTTKIRLSRPKNDRPMKNIDLKLKTRIIAELREIFDPEIPVNVYDLGLIYGIETNKQGRVTITMTLSTPGCPVADLIESEIRDRVAELEGVSYVETEIVWEPPWTQDMMSEEAQLELGIL